MKIVHNIYLTVCYINEKGDSRNKGVLSDGACHNS